MSKAAVTYTGSLPDGFVICPKSGQQFPFIRGEEFEVSFEVATNLSFQDPEAWQVSDEVKKAVQLRHEKNKQAKEEAEAKAKPAPAAATLVSKGKK
jgi:hypothetical protein